MDSSKQDQIAVKTSQLRALLNMMQVSGHDVSRPDLVEVIGVAAELAEDACTLNSEREESRTPGKGPASVIIEPCDAQSVVCHLRSVVAASNA